ncbi:MAG: NUDIX hydrolase [Anaerolineae bacterium]|nr:NUDIX hydrolase [Anaerolineae bacterium]MDW8070599.1 NUDIX hydrolase [Anaerolineae bacterium]
MAEERPPYRYCPYCRTELHDRFVYGRTRRVCPACGFIHFVDPKVGVAVLVENEGKVLLVRRAVAPAQGAWCLPSGFVESDEDPAEAAARECLEETGIQVRITGLLHVGGYRNDPRGAGVIIFYQAQVAGGWLTPGDDADAARFFAAHELPAEIAFRSNREILSRWQKGQLIPCPITRPQQ